MKRKKVDAGEIWKKVDDVLVPRLRLTVIERAVYSHLVRHSHLEGTARISFSVPWLARGIRVCGGAARRALRLLISNGALKLISRSKAGHVVDVRLPDQLSPALNEGGYDGRDPAIGGDIEQADFMNDTQLRPLIYARDEGLCFYCFRRLDPDVRCLDHVVPQAKSGTNSYRNLVSACVECNSQKGQQPADQFLRQMYRDGRLSSPEFADRLRELKALAAEKLRPDWGGPQTLPQRGGRNRIEPKMREGKVVQRHWAENGRRNFKFKIQNSK